MRIYSPRTIICIIFFIYTGCPSQSFGNTWPVFSPPSLEFLLSHHYIDTSQCPAGEGKLASNVVINMQFFCKTFCPEAWAWVGSSDSKCHALATGFEFQRYSITHYSDNQGTTLYTKVNALYGEQTKSKSSFNFVFISSKNHWYCYESYQPSHLLSCANDI